MDSWIDTSPTLITSIILILIQLDCSDTVWLGGENQVSSVLIHSARNIISRQYTIEVGPRIVVDKALGLRNLHGSISSQSTGNDNNG